MLTAEDCCAPGGPHEHAVIGYVLRGLSILNVHRIKLQLRGLLPILDWQSMVQGKHMGDSRGNTVVASYFGTPSSRAFSLVATQDSHQLWSIESEMSTLMLLL